MLKRVFPVIGRHNGYLGRDGTISLFLGHPDLFGKSTYERTSLGRIDRIRFSGFNFLLTASNFLRTRGEFYSRAK